MDQGQNREAEEEKMNEKNHYKNELGQFVWSQKGYEWLFGSVDTTQYVYMAKEKYKALLQGNAIEERMAELWLYENLQKDLPECRVLPHFYGYAPIDIEIIYPDGYSVWIDAKRKQEFEWSYRRRYEGTLAIDMLAGISEEDVARTIRDADYIVSIAVSDHIHSMTSETIASSGMVTGVVDTSKVTNEALRTYSTPNGEKYVRIDIEHACVVVKGHPAYTKLIQLLRADLEKQHTK